MIVQSTVDGVRTLRLDRPEKKNALTGAMYTVLAEALETGNEDENIRCQLICGHPGAFTAGNDIADFLTVTGANGLDGTPVIRFLKALALNEKPLVAAVDGLAIGIGTTLLMHCDMVFATRTSIFKSPFVDLGLVPEAGSSLLGPALMGHVRAFELLCLGRSFTSDQAFQVGLINQVLDENVEHVAHQCALEIAAKPPQAMGLSRRLLKGDTKVLLARVEEEAALFAKLLSAPETIATFQAFLTKKTKN